MRPVVFDGSIGWLSEAAGKRGVVIAGAHGFEDLCSRRFLKLLAERIAAAGCPVVQFDYPGCGDAAGDHLLPGQVEAWTDSIGAAADRLKQDTGVEEIILVGFRLGALLAPLAAARRADVVGLVLLAPPASGKAYVREMTALSRMIDAPLAAAGEPDAFTGLQVAGFRLTRDTLDDLSALNWKKSLAEAVVPKVLVMANGKQPDTAPSGAGEAQTNVEFAEFDGYSLLMCDPTANQIPVATLDRCVAWIGKNAGSGKGEKAGFTPSREPQILIGPTYVEEPVSIGDPQICGVLCRPRGNTATADPVVFLNAGGVPHVGWARGTVEAARALAAEGVASLRIDLPGLGQSDGPPEERLFLYDPRTTQDIVRVLDWMEKAGFPSVGLAGTCSGAFQAFHAARADKRVATLTIINPLCFSWNSSYALELAVWKTYETSKVALGQGRSALRETGPASRTFQISAVVSKIGRRLVRPGLETIKTALSLLHPSRLFKGSTTERRMRALSNRGVRILIVTSEGDLSLKEIDRHFGPGGERLRTMRGVARLTLAAADHTLTPYHARRALIARLIHFGLDTEPPVMPGQWGPASRVRQIFLPGR
jgi:pimeloyl-ACP methyl ester carboxylesterase